MSMGCWARWGLEDWRLLDQDGLVKILAEQDWSTRTDAQGRNVAMAALAQGCNAFMFDQLVTHATHDQQRRGMFEHEDAQGVKFPGYAMRYGSRMNTSSDTIWKAAVMHTPGLDLRNARGQGLLWQLSKLASATQQPWIWLPGESPLPITDPDYPAGAHRTIEEWGDGMPERMLETYIANRLLCHIPGRPRSQTSDVHALIEWFLPLYTGAMKSETLSRWPAPMQLLGRIVSTLAELTQNSLEGILPAARYEALLLRHIEPIWPDLVRLLPLATRPERHVIKWILENQRMGAHWEAMILATVTPSAAGEGSVRRL